LKFAISRPTSEKHKSHKKQSLLGLADPTEEPIQVTALPYYQLDFRGGGKREKTELGKRGKKAWNRGTPVRNASEHAIEWAYAVSRKTVLLT